MIGFAPAPNMAGDDGTSAYVVYTGTTRPPDGEPEDRAWFFRCSTVAAGAAVLRITWEVDLSEFNEELPAIERLLAGLSL